MILSRAEFAQMFNSIKSGLGNPDSPLWLPDDAVPSEWFVCVKPLRVHQFKSDYYGWCRSALSGLVRCYSSDTDNQKEWWGFTQHEDIVLWKLRWM